MSTKFKILDRYPLFIAVILVCISSWFYQCATTNAEPKIPEKKLTALDTFVNDYSDYFSHQMEICNCPGAALAIVQDTVLTWVQGYGHRDGAALQNVDAQTVFRLASVSKGFAALLTARLVDRGLLNWSDPVIKYLPDFEVNPASETPHITVAQVLSHSMGLPYHSYTNLIEEGMRLKDIIPLFKSVPLNQSPTQRYAYQNAAYGIIEKILEQASGGIPFATLLQNELITPLNLKRISYTFDAISRDSNVAYPHVRDTFTHYHQVPLTTKYYNAVSAGGVNASVSDMAVYIKVLMGQFPQLIRQSSLDSLFYPRINTDHHRRDYNFWPGVQQSYYGFGWRILDMGDHHRYYHGGYANDFRAEIAIDPSYKIGVCALFNAACPLSDYLVPSFFEHYEHWLALRDSTAISY